MKRLLLGAALAALSLVCLTGCRDNGGDADAARKAGYQACMDKAKAAGVLSPVTQPEIEAGCQAQAQQAQ